MKKIYFLGVIFFVFLVACTTNQTITPKSPSEATLAVQATPIKSDIDKNNIDTVLYLVKECATNLNDGQIGKSINGQVLALTNNNPGSKALFSSDEKLTDAQIKTLAAFELEAHKCRQVTNQLTNSYLRDIYQQFFAKMDRVYGDLISKKVTIGVANQERALLIDDFRTQWRDAIKKQISQGGKDESRL